MNTQDKLVGKTITVIDKYGYQNLSLRKLTATLGLTTGAFYKHFKSKDALYEKVAIELASIDNPTATSQDRQISALMRVFKEDLANATYIDLSNANVQSALEVFEQYGIIASGRALTIINTPVSIDEIPDQLL